MEESPPLYFPKAHRSAVTLRWGNSLLMQMLFSITRDRYRVDTETEEHQFSIGTVRIWSILTKISYSRVRELTCQN